MSIDLSVLPVLLEGQSYAIKFGFVRDRLESHQMLTSLKRRTMRDLAKDCAASRVSDIHVFEVYGFHTREVFDHIVVHLIDTVVDDDVRARVDRNLGQNRSLMYVAVCVTTDEEVTEP